MSSPSIPPDNSGVNDSNKSLFTELLSLVNTSQSSQDTSMQTNGFDPTRTNPKYETMETISAQPEFMQRRRRGPVKAKKSETEEEPENNNASRVEWVGSREEGPHNYDIQRIHKRPLARTVKSFENRFGFVPDKSWRNRDDMDKYNNETRYDNFETRRGQAYSNLPAPDVNSESDNADIDPMEFLRQNGVTFSSPQEVSKDNINQQAPKTAPQKNEDDSILNMIQGYIENLTGPVDYMPKRPK